MLLVVCHLLVVCRWVVGCCWLFVVGCLLFVCMCWLCVGVVGCFSWLLVVCCLLFFLGCLLSSLTLSIAEPNLFSICLIIRVSLVWPIETECFCIVSFRVGSAD